MSSNLTEIEQRLMDVCFDTLPGELHLTDALRLVQAILFNLREPTDEMLVGIYTVFGDSVRDDPRQLARHINAYAAMMIVAISRPVKRLP